MRIWLNHWFSTAYHLIELMRAGSPEPLTFIGSNSSGKAVYRRVCDEWYPESELPDDEYVDFCLRFCREHQVDVFIPRRGMTAIAKASEQFAALQVKLMLELDASTVTMLDDKLATYAWFRKNMPQLVPDICEAHSLKEFDAACETMKSTSGRLCYKLAVDEGARSFRVLDDSIESISALYAKPGSKITRRAAHQVLSGYDFHIPVLVMPYLSGADVSVDCLQTESGKLILPRFKVGRYHEVKPHPEIAGYCEQIMDALHLTMPANIQFKMEQDRPWLLEINTRMSGGLQLSCAATGINLPAIALQNLMGNEVPWAYPDPWNAAGVVNLETPIVVG